MTERGF